MRHCKQNISIGTASLQIKPGVLMLAFPAICETYVKFLPNAETLSILIDEERERLMRNEFEDCFRWGGKVSYRIT